MRISSYLEMDVCKNIYILGTIKGKYINTYFIIMRRNGVLQIKTSNVRSRVATILRHCNCEYSHVPS